MIHIDIYTWAKFKTVFEISKTVISPSVFMFHFLIDQNYNIIRLIDNEQFLFGQSLKVNSNLILHIQEVLYIFM